MRSTLVTIEDMVCESERISLSNFIGRFGTESFLVLIFILIAPNLIPFFSQFGIAEFTSGMVCLLAIQLMIGRELPWLPHKVVSKEIPCEKVSIIGRKLFPLLYKLDLITKSRLMALSDARLNRVYGLMIFILAFLIILPLPFFNYAPAVVIMAMVLGLLSRDGFLLLIGMGLFACVMSGLVFSLYMMGV